MTRWLRPTLVIIGCILLLPFALIEDLIRKAFRPRRRPDAEVINTIRNTPEAARLGEMPNE